MEGENGATTNQIEAEQQSTEQPTTEQNDEPSEGEPHLLPQSSLYYVKIEFFQVKNFSSRKNIRQF